MSQTGSLNGLPLAASSAEMDAGDGKLGSRPSDDVKAAADGVASSVPAQKRRRHRGGGRGRGQFQTPIALTSGFKFRTVAYG